MASCRRGAASHRLRLRRKVKVVNQCDSKTPSEGNNAGGGASSRLPFSKFHPVGRAVQAAVCRTAEAGAIPARDSIPSGIGVDRHTPVFQTGIEGALPSCPSTFSQVNPACRQRPRTVEVMAGGWVRCAWDFFRDAGAGDGQDFTGLASVVRLHPRVAFGLQTLTVKSRLLTGENSVRIRGDPPFPHPW